MKLRPLLGILIALLLAITSQSMAVSRGMAAASGQMVICTGDGPVTVYMDATGAPTSAPHLCADCIIALNPGQSVYEFKLMRAPRAQNRKQHGDTKEKPLGTLSAFQPRAPPLRLLS